MGRIRTGDLVISSDVTVTYAKHKTILHTFCIFSIFILIFITALYGFVYEAKGFHFRSNLPTVSQCWRQYHCALLFVDGVNVPGLPHMTHLNLLALISSTAFGRISDMCFISALAMFLLLRFPDTGS